MTGDPHLVGLRGQKFDFTGQDGGIYSVVNDGPCNIINMRVTALPGTPEITYITGLGMVLCGDVDGTDESRRHTVEIIVDDPHNLGSKCPHGEDALCLAEGALTVLIDGESVAGPGEVRVGFIFASSPVSCVTANELGKGVCVRQRLLVYSTNAGQKTRHRRLEWLNVCVRGGGGRG